MIGAGAGGLTTAAALLARTGLDVTMLEAQANAGGFAASTRPWPYTCPVVPTSPATLENADAKSASAPLAADVVSAKLPPWNVTRLLGEHEARGLRSAPGGV